VLQYRFRVVEVVRVTVIKGYYHMAIFYIAIRERFGQLLERYGSGLFPQDLKVLGKVLRRYA